MVPRYLHKYTPADIIIDKNHNLNLQKSGLISPTHLRLQQDSPKVHKPATANVTTILCQTLAPEETLS